MADVVKSPRPDQMLSRGVSLVPQGRGTLTALSVRDNLRVGATGLADRSQVESEIDRWFSIFPRLAERHDQIAGTLSGGEQQMLAIARALMSRPRLLLCDEISLGLAPIIVSDLFDTLREVERRIRHRTSARRAERRARARHRLSCLPARGRSGRCQWHRRVVPREQRHPQSVLGLLGRTFMDILLARLFSGMTAGSIYVLIALALVVVFRSSTTINFAQGEFALFTTYFAWWLTEQGVNIYVAVIPHGHARLRHGRGRRTVPHPAGPQARRDSHLDHRPRVVHRTERHGRLDLGIGRQGLPVGLPRGSGRLRLGARSATALRLDPGLPGDDRGRRRIVAAVQQDERRSADARRGDQPRVRGSVRHQGRVAS